MAPSESDKMTDPVSTVVEVRREGNKATLVPAGDVLTTTVEVLKPQLKDMVRGGVDTIVFDLERVGIVDSAGIGLLVATHNSVEKVGGSISVIRASKGLVDLFKALRLDQRFPVTGV
jgi:anti-anti-sigma factor